ncbi:AI-2E family transporter [Penaeicola halotolerans]|uniref:AI-2E family transporter n=1 Tax=Penaeicola halotolerans TaxID=2793196 RepID=UPI001CF8F31D|nr:AI-2E family transporter [Penaeicola halotolerans]
MKKAVLYTLLFLAVFIFLSWYFSNILLYFIFSLVLAAILRPVANKIHDFQIFGLNIPRGLAILCAFLLISGVISLLVLLFIPLIRSQIQTISEINPDYVYGVIMGPVERLEDFLIYNQLTDNSKGFLINSLKQTLVNNLSTVSVQGFINSLIDTTSSFLIALMAILFITFFLLYENGLLRRNIINLVPNAYFELSVATFHKVERLLSNYLVGLLIQMSSIFTVASLGLTIFNVEYALTIAVFAAVANLIPYAGPLLGATFGILVGISTASFETTPEYYWLMIKIVSVFSFVQLLDNVLLQPLIFSKSVKAHPLEIFVIIFVGAKIAGVLGMILAIPVYTIFRVSIIELFQGYRSYRIFKS